MVRFTKLEPVEDFRVLSIDAKTPEEAEKKAIREILSDYDDQLQPLVEIDQVTVTQI
jgi:hypothetical protein